MVPFPVPEAVTVHQVALLTADHEDPVATEKEVDPAFAPTFWFPGVTLKVAAELTVKDATIPIAA